MIPSRGDDVVQRPNGLDDGIGYAEIDGVPVLFAEREGSVISGGIMFRVGWADETFTTAGITHLVEHLALHGQRLGDGHLNGETGDRLTHFHITGEEDEVVAFLEQVCSALGRLPVERLETEVRILRTEQGGLPPMGGGRAYHRFGFGGRGLLVAMQAGLDRLTAAEVQSWAAERFTADNAVLWIAAPAVPEDLRLPLPRGERMPVPRHEEVRASRPSWFTSQAAGVMVEALVPRGRGAAALFRDIVTQRLMTRLREELGASYSAGCSIEFIDDDVLLLTLWADAFEGRDQDVAHGIIDVLEELAGASGATDDELRRAHREAARSLQDLRPSDLLPETAHRLLNGIELLDAEERSRRLRSITAGDIAGVAGAVLADANVQINVPPFEREGFAAIDERTAHPVRGVRFQSAEAKDAHLVVGLDGVSLIWGASTTTVLFADAVAVRAWPDGARWFMARDGSEVIVEPTLFHRLRATTISDLDRHIARHLILAMPERSRAEIPVPARGRRQLPSEPKPRKAMRWRGVGRWAVAPGLLLLMLTPIFGVLSFGDTIAIGRGETQLSEALFGWGITAISAAATWFLIAGIVRRRRWDRENGPL